MTELCPCGLPLHYASPAVQQAVQSQVDTLGTCVEVEIKGFGTWQVPRHYIALHGIAGCDVPALAERYQWSRVA